MSGPRILLFTGKGGVGKTTVAAGTGLACAANGQRTLVLVTLYGGNDSMNMLVPHQDSRYYAMRGGLAWLVANVPPTRPLALLAAYIFAFAAVTSSGALLAWIALRPRTPDVSSVPRMIL